MKTINEKRNAMIEANNALKETQKNFKTLCKIILAMKDNEAVKNYLNAYSLTIDQVTDIEYIRRGLTYSTFIAESGKTYEAPARMVKGQLTEVRGWSFWMVLQAAAKVRNMELKEAWKAKEESLKAIEKAEKEAAKKEAKAKKATEKKAAKKETKAAA